MYQILLSATFRKKLKSLDSSTRENILKNIKKLSENPFSHQKIKKIIAASRKNMYRLRVGRFRVIYIIIKKDKTIDVFDFFMKKSSSDYKKYL